MMDTKREAANAEQIIELQQEVEALKKRLAALEAWAGGPYLLQQRAKLNP